MFDDFKPFFFYWAEKVRKTKKERGEENRQWEREKKEKKNREANWEEREILYRGFQFNQNKVYTLMKVSIWLVG